MFKFFAGLLGFIANVGAASPSAATVLWVWDEPECPESLLD